MNRGLLLLLAVSFGQRISRAEELPVKIGEGSGEAVELAGASGGRSVAVRSPRSRRFAMILPGTKWCGRGTSWREGDSSLYGVHVAADRCCRQHDLCPQSIGAQQTKYNYFNHRTTTISHCDCDNDFRRCLRNAGGSVSNEVGYLYFNLLRFKCFTLGLGQVCHDRALYGMGPCRNSTLQMKAQIHDATPY